MTTRVIPGVLGVAAATWGLACAASLPATRAST